MNWKAFIRKKLLGSDITDEYVCFSANSFPNPLRTIAKLKSGAVDITTTHVLLGYKPLLVGIYFPRPGPPSMHDEEMLLVEFCRTAHPEKIVARLELKRTHVRTVGTYDFFLFEGTHGDHRFLTGFHQRMNRWYESWKRKGAGNIGLPGNLYDQVRIAYSIPRNISVISLGAGDRFNFFPTDLHGPVGAGHYVGSLRREGKACQQVEASKRIVISTLKPERFREAYALGKNHMRELRDLSEFHTLPERSAHWGLPLPESAAGYRELEWRDYWDAGIHRIHFYETMNQQRVNDPEVLCHVHRHVAQWINDQGLRTEWLIREVL